MYETQNWKYKHLRMSFKSLPNRHKVEEKKKKTCILIIIIIHSKFWRKEMVSDVTCVWVHAVFSLDKASCDICLRLEVIK